jgi:GTP-binding protein
MKLEAEFLLSASTIDACPRWDRAEVALAGRSNVGKSSLLNALTRRTNLARTSKTPGRTRSLNFFTIGRAFALVDLPGFGYAKLPRIEAAKISGLMDDYLTHRQNLVGLVLLIDFRRGPEAAEKRLASLCLHRKLELIVVATKADKLRPSHRAMAVRSFEILGVPPLICSAANGEGIDMLRRRIFIECGASCRLPSSA